MNHNYDAYYDQPASRSPTSQRQSSLHRQGSRNQFEQPNYLPSGLFTAEDYSAPRYDGRNFGDMRHATIGGYGGGAYDMGGASWNAGAFINNNTLNGMGGSTLRKPLSRGGRSGLPSVSFASSYCSTFNRTSLLTTEHRLGLISRSRCRTTICTRTCHRSMVPAVTTKSAWIKRKI